MLRFDDAATGDPIAILYTAHSASGTLENAMNVDANGTTSGTIDSRTVTTDIAGLSARYVEEYYGNGCVALYFAGATGDQWGAMRAEVNYLKVSPKSDIEYVERTYLPIDDQWKLLDIASSRLGYAVVDAANAIQSGALHRIGMSHKKCSYKKLDTDKRGKSAPFTYVQATNKDGSPATIDMNILVMSFDDLAILGVKSEMNIQTLKDIRVASPYRYNVMQGWVAYDSSDPDGYLPDQEGFDQSGKQASKTKFMPGTAEEVVADAVEMLDGLYA